MHDYIWQMIHHHYFFIPWHSAYSETQKILALALKTAHSTSIYVGVRCHKNVYIYIYTLYLYLYIVSPIQGTLWLAYNIYSTNSS